MIKTPKWQRRVVGGRAALLVSGRPAYGTGLGGLNTWGGHPSGPVGQAAATHLRRRTLGKGQGLINHQQQRECCDRI